MRLQAFLLCLLFLPLAALGGGRRTAALVGGWQPIKNLSDPHVKEIGEFAVNEYNKQSKANLKFQSVIGGEKQVVSGTNYRLTVVAKDGAASNNYEAVVWEKPWLHFMNLTSFKPK